MGELMLFCNQCLSPRSKHLIVCVNAHTNETNKCLLSHTAAAITQAKSSVSTIRMTIDNVFLRA